MSQFIKKIKEVIASIVTPLLTMLSVSALIDMIDIGHKTDVVLNQKECNITRKELREKTLTLAKVLMSMEIRVGDIIVSTTNKSTYESIELFLAANRIGAVVCFLDASLPDTMVIKYLNDFKSPLLVCDHKDADYLARIREEATGVKFVLDYKNFELLPSLASEYHGKVRKVIFGGKKDALISFTSGSTSGPKPMLFTNQNLIAAAIYPKESSGIKLHDKKITSWLSYVKFDCPYGFWTSVMTPIIGGSSVILTPDITLSTESFDYYFSKQPRAISGLPSLLEYLEKYLSEDTDLSGVRIFISGGEKLSEEESWAGLEFFKRHGATVKIRNGYGIGEALGCVSIAVGAGYRPDTVGRIVNGVKVLVLDPETGEELGLNQTGMLYVGGKHILKRYWDRPELTAEKIIIRSGERFVLTGDLGQVDEKGFITLVGRATFLINSIPAKVYYDIVRAAVMQSELVADASVVKIPDETLRFRTVAFVVLRLGYDKGERNAQKIIAKSHEAFEVGSSVLKLKEYEIPKFVVFLDELPRTKADKVDFRLLEKVAEKLPFTGKGKIDYRSLDKTIDRARKG